MASRLSSPIRLDGRVDEAAWMAIEPLPAVMSSPTFGVEPSERTEFRIAYDENYLYISGVLHDREPGGIRASCLSGGVTRDLPANICDMDANAPGVGSLSLDRRARQSCRGPLANPHP